MLLKFLIILCLTTLTLSAVPSSSAASSSNQELLKQSQLENVFNLVQIVPNIKDISSKTNNQRSIIDYIIQQYLECIYQSLDRLQRHWIDLILWIDSILNRIRRLKAMRESCEIIEWEFLRDPCFQALEALQLVELAILAFEVQGIIDDFPVARDDLVYEFYTCHREIWQLRNNNSTITNLFSDNENILNIKFVLK